jgi:hypothetical protein
LCAGDIASHGVVLVEETDMSVGFKLRPNTYSRMSHLPSPYKINEAGVPVPGAPDFIPQAQLRYGTPLPPWQPLDSAPGLHEPEFEYFLSNIATKNPDWFEQNGYGKATGNLTADFIEAHDAWYGQGAYEAVWHESERLDGQAPPVEPPPVDPPPVDPPLPPPVDPTKERHHFTAEMRDTAIKMDTWVPAERLKQRKRLQELAAEVLK